MRALLLLWSLPIALAQEAAAVVTVDVPAVMERLSCATTALQRAIAAGDRSAMVEPLAVMAEQVVMLRRAHAPVPLQARRTAALDAMAQALADLQSPVGTGEASDPWDFACLRRACTACHLQTRDGNDERGIFPNEGNSVFGRLQLEGKDGVPRPDGSGIVLFLEAPGLEVRPLGRPQVISQRERRFLPNVLAVTRGTTVRFPNDDVVFHNVFSLSRSNPFDLGSYGKGLEKEHVLANPGLVKVHCNIHPDMVANVLVLDTGFSAVTSTDGSWVIPDVPDGDYTLRVWHPFAEEQRRPLPIAGGKAHTVAITVRETRPRVQHANKHGRAYPEKY